MLSYKKPNKKLSSRRQIDIESVEDGMLRLSRGRYRKVLSVSPVNFELKSEAEQDAIIDTYESFLNSLSCPLQILIRTREIDIDNYLAELSYRLASETEEIYRGQLANYDEFIRSLVKDNRILTRKFYVVVPYDAPTKIDAELIQEQLNIRVDIVTKGLSRLGIHAREVDSLAVLDLFYSFYSPGQSKLQPLTEQALRILHEGYVQKEVAA